MGPYPLGGGHEGWGLGHIYIYIYISELYRFISFRNVSTRFRVAVIPCRSVSASFRVWKFRFIPFQVRSVSRNSVSFRFMPNRVRKFRFIPFRFWHVSPPFRFTPFRPYHSSVDFVSFRSVSKRSVCPIIWYQEVDYIAYGLHLRF